MHMPELVAADAQPTMSPEIERAYKQFVEQHWGEVDPILLAITMFNAGGRHAVKAMVEFGDIIPQLHRIEGRVRVLLEMLEAFS